VSFAGLKTDEEMRASIATFMSKLVTTFKLKVGFSLKDRLNAMDMKPSELDSKI